MQKILKIYKLENNYLFLDIMNDKIYSRSRIRLPKIELKNKENNRNTIKILKIIVILVIAIYF